jgi:hypothetical protein
MKKYEVGSQLIPILDCCTYWGQMDPDKWFDPLLGEHTADEIESFWYNFNFPVYKEKVAELFTPLIQNWCKKINDQYFPITVDNIHHHSPRQYNYGGDEMYFDLYTDLDMKEWARNHPEAIRWYCDHWDYRNRPGFVSLMPKNFDQFIYAVDNDPERALAVILTYLSEIKIDGYITLTDHDDHMTRFRESLMDMW